MASKRSYVTGSDLLTGLQSLGVVPGDIVFIHASLSKFGYVEGGADTVIDALLEAVSPQGTLAMPGFTFQLMKDLPQPVLDVRHTPVWTSKVYERFRTREPVHRSHHLTHSVCAVGARAKELTATHSITPCGAQSPFRKFAAWNAKILLLGISHNSSTTFHAVEEQEQLFYVDFRQAPGATIIDESGEQRPLASKVHQMSRKYDFNRMNDLLEREGIQQQALIGDSIVRCVDVHRMFETTVEAVHRDPEVLLMQGNENMRIPVCQADLA